MRNEKFILFGGSYTYPDGGSGDFAGAYHNIDDLLQAYLVGDEEWYNAINLKTMKIITNDDLDGAVAFLLGESEVKP